MSDAASSDAFAGGAPPQSLRHAWYARANEATRDMTSASPGSAAQAAPSKQGNGDASAQASEGKKGKGKKKGGKQKQKKPQQQGQGKKKTKLGMQISKVEDFGEWYQEVLTKAEFIEYYPVSGCYVLRPDAYFIWEQVQDFINAKIRAKGVRNAYFPMFVKKAQLEVEEKHVEGFKAEVAWVTKSGDSELAEPIAIRPTSETVMYPAYAKWIKSHRDLPLRLNQWCNVVRWEFKNPTPFIRTREFLWQEGHSAFATKEEADAEVYDILHDVYAAVYEQVLAVSVVPGRKTENEKFPGADFTTTIEAFIPSTGRGVQAATSHGLGHHFAKMFEIEFEDENKNKAMPFQNSWGLTTRSLGVMIMQHADDKGLVLPPRAAATQVVIVPIPKSNMDEATLANLRSKSEQFRDLLKAAGVRVVLDDRTDRTPGWKYSDWELKGVPLRIELGKMDLEKQSARFVRRDTGAKEDFSWDVLAETAVQMLEAIQETLLQRSRDQLTEGTIFATTWDEFMAALQAKKLVMAPWCGDADVEDVLKLRTSEDSKLLAVDDPKQLTGKAKSLCIPFKQPELPEGTKCIIKTDRAATEWVLWGRSY